MNTQTEVARIRARWNDNYGATNTSGYKEPFIRARHDVAELLAMLDAQAAVLEAAGEYLSAEPETFTQLQALDKLHDKLDALKGAGNGE